MNILVDEKGGKRFHDVTQIKEETLNQVDESTAQGHSASTGMPAHEVLQGQTPAEGSSDSNTIPKSDSDDNGVAKMSVGNGRPTVNKSLFVAGRARVADPTDWGEQTPGAPDNFRSTSHGRSAAARTSWRRSS